VPGDSRVKLTVDKVPRDPAVRSHLGIVADVALDDRIVTYDRADADIGAGRYDNPRSDHTLGLDGGEVLKFRSCRDRYTLPDGGELANPHPSPYDGLALCTDLATVEKWTELVADDSG